MKKYFKITSILLIVLIAVFAIYHFFFTTAPTHIEVKTADVVVGTLSDEVTATGTVEPVDQVDVGTQVSGLVEKIYVDFNSVVKKGQLLAELDKTNLNESVANAQAAYNAAMSQLQYQQQNYNRQKNMYEAQVISQSDFESAEYQLKDAKATVAQSQTILRQAKTNLGYANIYSPIDGVILSKEVEEGQTVAASVSTPTLFTIAKDITKMQVEADVDEADIGFVEEGQRVVFTVDAYPEIEFTGRVKQVRLGATTTSNVVTYTVIIDADNPDQKLKPGLTATITIFTKELKDITVVPAQAFNFTPNREQLMAYYSQNNIETMLPEVNKNTTVWVINNDKTIEQRAVTKGESDGVNVQILEGVKAGEIIVLGFSETTQATHSESGDMDSPFMPKRPNRESKKATPTN